MVYSYPEMVGCPSVLAGDSIRNSERIQEFADDKVDDIKEIIFLSNHALLHPDKKFTLHGNMFCFNYAGQPTIDIGYSPNYLRDQFFANLSKQPQTSHFKKEGFYEFISMFKDDFLAPESPLSLYGGGDEINDMIVLAGGSIFEDEFDPYTNPPALKENPASAWLFSREIGIQDLFAGFPGNLVIYNQYNDLTTRNGEFPLVRDTTNGRLVMKYNPYGYKDTTGIRPVFLSDIFNILKYKIRTGIIVSSSVSLIDEQLEAAVNDYMNRHVVLINTGCRCTGQPGDLLRRTVSSRHPHSSRFSRTKYNAKELGLQPFDGGRKRAIRITRKEPRRKNGTNCKRKRRRPRSITRTRTRTHKTKLKK
jgi:hypothetical protein